MTINSRISRAMKLVNDTLIDGGAYKFVMIYITHGIGDLGTGTEYRPDQVVTFVTGHTVDQVTDILERAGVLTNSKNIPYADDMYPGLTLVILPLHKLRTPTRNTKDDDFFVPLDPVNLAEADVDAEATAFTEQVKGFFTMLSMSSVPPGHARGLVQ